MGATVLSHLSSASTKSTVSAGGRSGIAPSCGYTQTLAALAAEAWAHRFRLGLCHFIDLQSCVLRRSLGFGTAPWGAEMPWCWARGS